MERYPVRPRRGHVAAQRHAVHDGDDALRGLELRLEHEGALA